MNYFNNQSNIVEPLHGSKYDFIFVFLVLVEPLRGSINNSKIAIDEAEHRRCSFNISTRT